MNTHTAHEFFASHGIDARQADPEILRAVYHTLAKKLHPDRGGSAEAMKDLNRAYDVLNAAADKGTYAEEQQRERHKRAEQERRERERAAKERAAKERAEERAAKERAEQESHERERAERQRHLAKQQLEQGIFFLAVGVMFLIILFAVSGTLRQFYLR